MLYEITKEAYDGFRKIERTRWVKLKNAFLLQVMELGGEYVIMHITGVKEEEGRYTMEADIKERYETSKDAERALKLIKIDMVRTTGVMPL